jgi:hypothetical protein
MASLSELANVLQTSPAQAFRQEDIDYQKYQLQQQKLQQAQQSMAPKGLPGMTGVGVGGKPQGLGAMAGNMLGPQYKLTTPDGELTSAGLVNQTLITAQTDQQNAQSKAQEAQYFSAMGDNKAAEVADMEARRYLDKAQRTKEQAQKLKTEAKDDFASSLYGANSQGEYDQRLKDALERTGIEPPKDFPTVWSPEMKSKLLSKMSPTMRAKIEAQDRAKEAQKNANERADRLNRSIQAISRDGGTVKPEKFNAQVSTLKQDIGTGYKRLDDLISMAEPGKIPGASPAFGRLMKGDGVLAAAEAAAAKGIMPPGLKKSDAILLGLAFDIASARGGGRGQLSDTKIREVQQMMPLSTDDQKTRAYKISLIENALDEANTSLPKNAQKDKSSIMKKTGGFDESKFIKPSAAEKEKLKLSPDDLALINKYSTGK